MGPNDQATATSADSAQANAGNSAPQRPAEAANLDADNIPPQDESWELLRSPPDGSRLGSRSIRSYKSISGWSSNCP